jgi:hypothetical protein
MNIAPGKNLRRAGNEGRVRMFVRYVDLRSLRHAKEESSGQKTREVLYDSHKCHYRQRSADDD